MGVKGYFIQYKFIIPENMKHSSYTYQKLFRALYGYTQSVFKSNGKIYHYHRPGVLSSTPYLRPGKNCVIIPPGNFQKLLEFFKTGRNPTHVWRGKGDWKAVYYMNEKTVDEKNAASAIESLLERHLVATEAGKKEKLASVLNIAASKTGEADKAYVSMLLAEAAPVATSDWFKNAYSQSDKLKAFYSNYKKLKTLA